MRKGYMKPKLLPLLERCIEDGLARGYVRAFKHDDNPPVSHVHNVIVSCIMEEIHEWFDLEELKDY